MIRQLSPAFAVALCFAASPLLAEDKEHPAAIQIEITLGEEKNAPVQRAAVHVDLSEGHDSFSGTTIMHAADGGRWIVEVWGWIGDAETAENDRTFSVKVTDSKQLENKGEDGKLVQPVAIFESNRVWHGPGTYRLAEYGQLVLSAKVADTPELEKMAAAPAHPPVEEKR